MYDNDGEREERELVLGNRQLLGIFFVGTLLCGVFFAMGYVVGGNSAKAGPVTAVAAATDSAAASTSDGKREEPQAPSITETAVPTPSSPSSSSSDSGSALPPAEPRVADNPVAAGARPPTPVSAAREAPQTVQSMPAQKPVASAPMPAVGGVYIAVPEKGTSYWQVTATQKGAAEGLVNSLRERQLPAILAESSKPELFRVLVGPYHTATALADAKRKLTDLGFDGLIPQKY